MVTAKTFSRVVSGRSFVNDWQNITELVKIVLRTGGPAGHLVVVPGSEYGEGECRFTKDGYTVGKNLLAKDKGEEAILKFFKKELEATNKDAGDGTTFFTSVFINASRNLIQLNLKENDIVDFKKGFEFAEKNIYSAIEKAARPIEIGSKEVEDIATTAANGDSTIGKSIAEALNKAGRNGVITVENSKSSEEVGIEVTSGLGIDRGFISPYFANTKNGSWEAENPLVVVLNQKLSAVTDVLPIFEKVLKDMKKPLLLIAEDMDGEALGVSILNKIRGVIDICAIKSPGFGDSRLAMLEDISVLTGAKLINKDSGTTLAEACKPENIDELFGTARKVTVTKDKTTITGNNESGDAITSRIKFIEEQISRSTSEYDKGKLKERMAKLAGGVAVIRVGGHSEAEVNERKDRFEDALNAAKAAVEEGIIPGGGVTQLAVEYCLQNSIRANNDLSYTSKLVASAILSAFASNISNIVRNTARSPEMVIEKLRQTFKEGSLEFDNLSYDKITTVYDAVDGKYVSPKESGLNDAAKVCKIAFSRAANLVKLLCLCGASVVQIKEEDTNQSSRSPAGMPHGMGMDHGMEDMMY